MRIKWSDTRRLDKEQITQIAKDHKAVGQAIAEDGTITLFRQTTPTTHEYLSFAPSVVRDDWYLQLGETWKELPYLPSDMQKVE